VPTVPKSSPLWAQSNLKWLYKGTQPLDVLLWQLGVSELITVGMYTGTLNSFGPSSYSNTSREAHFLGTHIYFQLGVEKPRPRTLPPPLRSPCKIWLLYFIPCGRIHTCTYGAQRPTPRTFHALDWFLTWLPSQILRLFVGHIVFVN